MKTKQKFIKEKIKKHYKNCYYNMICNPKDVNSFNYCLIKSPNITSIYTCMGDWASRCSDYCCKYSENEAEKEFLKIVKDSSLCGKYFPKLFSLLWVIQDKNDSIKIEDNIIDIIDNEIEQSNNSIWYKIKQFFRPRNKNGK